jgi:hypothetical protein
MSLRNSVIISLLGMIMISCTKDSNSTFLTIPFKIIDGKMIIKVIINETDTSNFMFDNATEITILDSIYYKKIRLKVISQHIVFCPSNEKKLPVARCFIRVGTLKLDTTNAILSSLKYYNRIQGLKINGIIGRDILRKRIIKIDFIKSNIIIFNPNYIPNLKGYNDLTSFRGPSILAEAVLQNGKCLTGKFILDSGCPEDIELPINPSDTTLVESYIGKNKTGYLRDVCGARTKSYEGNLHTFKISNSIFDTPKVIMAITESGVLSYKGKEYIKNDEILKWTAYMGLIGLPILKNFDIIIDDVHSKIYLKKITKIRKFLSHQSP